MRGKPLLAYPPDEVKRRLEDRLRTNPYAESPEEAKRHRLVTDKRGLVWPRQALEAVIKFYIRAGDPRLAELLQHDYDRFRRLDKAIKEGL